ncbi:MULTISPECIES: MFS transporter [unclassified Rhodococcus (in: high G+C Gram-positive bacteria)]|uniref:MFS transporter n=1 Tax=unclassified Rhodococcus (in: high G+C Gram-positive bacteria) TaxID=192944 RepID=UPI000B9C35A1|nr:MULTISPECIES: MFS transporter [unclassified Rhodococcus (in: high G+C Gram-positive bacteria)]OZD06536.1 MFS transporter [Rhodococcus sp. 06-235-1A]OZF42013.1 MFS transporter [Rhodococcus sp. 14-2470-1a]
MTSKTLAAPVTHLKDARRASMAAALASSLEWYDFFIYGTAAALVFNKTFFYTGDPVLSAINSFASVAVAFVARPFGGVVAGHFGDKIGRKPVLVAAIVLMACATFMIGLTPDTEIIWVAPAFLVLLRIAQGLALGAQWGGAMLLATEYAPENRRGFYGSFAQIGVPVGVLTGNLVFLLLSNAMDNETFLSWGWRVPFLLSILMLAVGLYIHKYLEETPSFRNAEKAMLNAPKQSSPVIQVIRNNGSTIIQAAGTFVVINAIFYSTIIASLQYADVVLGISTSQVLLPILAGAAVQVVLMPLSALASDIYGRVRVYTIGITLLGLWAFPMWWIFSQATPDNTLPIWISIVLASALISISYGPQAALFSEIFPAALRYSGASLGYQIATIVGGATPVIMVSLINGDSDNWWRFSAYIVALSIVALISVAMIHRNTTHSNRESV